MKPKELTIRGLILGALLTTVFTAANVYLGLKVGLTFASSIPAAVISMAVLKVGSATRGDAPSRGDVRTQVGRDFSRADSIAQHQGDEAREGLTAIVLGSIASAGLAIVSATRVAAAEIQGFFRVGPTSASGYDIAFSLALFGAGHLVGLSVGMAMLTGLLIAWVGAVPILTHLQPAAAGISLAAHTDDIWRHQVRFIGAGAIAVSAIWTLAK